MKIEADPGGVQPQTKEARIPQELQKAREFLPRALGGSATLLTHLDLQLLVSRTAREKVYGILRH